MSLLAELVAFYVAVAIKICLLRRLPICFRRSESRSNPALARYNQIESDLGRLKSKVVLIEVGWRVRDSSTLDNIVI
jgi:hypothetical protein